MKNDDISDLIKLVALCLVLAFLFAGEPDLWDLMHEAAMQRLTPPSATVLPSAP